MLKLPSLLIGLSLLISGFVRCNYIEITIGIILLALGLFFFGWDFGSQKNGDSENSKDAPTEK